MVGTGLVQMVVIDASISIACHLDMYSTKMVGKRKSRWKKLIFNKKSIKKEINLLARTRTKVTIF
jgi:hypothetical protein